MQWHDFQEDFRQMLGEAHILSLSNALHRAGLEPEGSLHDASWDAYNGARLMETAYSEDFGQLRGKTGRGSLRLFFKRI